QEDLDPLALSRHDVELALEDLHELGPFLRPFENALEPAQRGNRLWVYVQRVTIGLGRTRRVLETILEQRTETKLLADGLLRVVDGTRLLGENFHKVVDLAAVFVDPLERVESRTMCAVDLKGTAIVRDRLIGLIEVPIDDVAEIGQDQLAV